MDCLPPGLVGFSGRLNEGGMDRAAPSDHCCDVFGQLEADVVTMTATTLSVNRVSSSMPAALPARGEESDG